DAEHSGLSSVALDAALPVSPRRWTPGLRIIGHHAGFPPTAPMRTSARRSRSKYPPSGQSREYEETTVGYMAKQTKSGAGASRPELYLNQQKRANRAA